MRAGKSLPAEQRRRWVHAGLIALLALVSAVGVLRFRPLGLRDAGQVFTYAYNLSHHGVFTLDRSDGPELIPDAMRGPAYPSLVALSMLASQEARSADLACFLDAEGRCAAAQIAAKRINLLILALLVATTFLVTCDVCGSVAAGWIVGGAVLLVARLSAGGFSPDPLAALALLVHAWCLYRLASGSEGAGRLAVAGGVAIGVLCLTRSMFFYWLVLLTLALPFVAAWPVLRAHLPRLRVVAALLGCGWVLVGGWVLRNAAQTGAWSISGRGGSVLAVRAEYSSMSGREYWAGYLLWTGPLGRSVLDRAFEPADYARFNDLLPRSFKGLARKLYLPLNFPELAAAQEARTGVPLSALPGGAVEAALVPGEPLTEQSLSRAAWAVIRENWAMHVALIPLFAVRGASLLLPLLAGAVFLAVRRRAWPMLAFLAPAIFSIAFHAAITHYLTRYSIPLLPCAGVALAWWITAGRARNAVGTPDESSDHSLSEEGGSSLERDLA
jgi:hypothetical protein